MKLRGASEKTPIQLARARLTLYMHMYLGGEVAPVSDELETTNLKAR